MREWTPIETAWLAGLLEGEGCFTVRRWRRRPGGALYTRPVLAVAMTDEDVVRRVSEMTGVRAEFRHPPSYRAKGWKPQYRVTATGGTALEVMRRIRPHMGARRFERISDLIDRYAP